MDNRTKRTTKGLKETQIDCFVRGLLVSGMCSRWCGKSIGDHQKGRSRELLGNTEITTA